MKTVAAIIVTYNRLEDLKKCLATLRTQTRPIEEIFVINNGSTDGTAAWLATEGGVTVVQQANLGGAGGFATGIETAFRAGYAWIWCMDDDCLATPGALETLLSSPDLGPAIKNCVSISTKDPSELAFYVDRPNRKYRKVADMAGVDLIYGVASFFNGTLISAEVVAKIGVPDPKLFIWGDEMEYMTRALKMGFPVVTIPRAVFYHPPSFDRNGVPWPGAWKQYYAVRNQRRVFQNMHGKTVGFFVYVRWSSKVTLQQLTPRRINRGYDFLVHAEAALDGVLNRFGKRPETILTLRLYRWFHRPAARSVTPPPLPASSLSTPPQQIPSRSLPRQ